MVKLCKVNIVAYLLLTCLDGGNYLWKQKNRGFLYFKKHEYISYPRHFFDFTRQICH